MSSLLPKSQERRGSRLVDSDCLPACLHFVYFHAHDTHVYAHSSLFSHSGRFIFLRIGSNMNGLLNPVLDVAVCIISDRMPVGPSFLPVSYSRAIFWRKLTACHLVSITSFGKHNTTANAYRPGKPSRSANLKPTQVSASRRRTHDNIRILLDFPIGNGFIHGNLEKVSHAYERHEQGKDSSRLTGSSSAWMAKVGMRMAVTESADEASR
jgi:hypothetical protein